MKKILLAGGAGMGNLGDEALMLSVVQKIKFHIPDAQITISTPNDDITSWTIPEIKTVPAMRTAVFGAENGGAYYSANSKFRDHWARIAALETKLEDLARIWAILGMLPHKMQRRLNKIWSKNLNREPLFFDGGGARTFFKALNETDLVVVYGGGILTSATRSRLWEMALLARLCKAKNIPIIFRSHQIGPIETVEDAQRLKEIAEISDFIGVRDVGVSANEFERVTKHRSVEAIDDAFFADLPKVSIPNLPEKYIAVAYRAGQTEPADFRDSFARLVASASDRLQLPLVYVPQGAFDVDALHDLKTRVGREGFVLDFTTLSWAPYEALSNAELAIALPHHSVIFALKGDVPIISPVHGSYYAAKNRGSMRNFGLEDFVLVYDDNPSSFYERGLLLLDDVLPRLDEIKAEFAAKRKDFIQRGEDFDRDFFAII
ncbi:polysaccharide pyruvyl transferase family protein [uncultured Celeribacter sp.]|uniref:polysaccharide pyruvyl transferase family protein n=1 Tax=uncultured Celeribacter sp. TaxID=1303376 RepID=UPI002AA88D1E|nr:polysaccharide pyruvyl transferase family protein [uncultured Celeribacter sp.]